MSASDLRTPTIQYADGQQPIGNEKIVGNSLSYADLAGIMRSVSRNNPLPVDLAGTTVNITASGLALETTLSSILSALLSGISITSSALPTGAATEITLQAVLAALGGGAGTFTSVADFIVTVAGTAVQGAAVAAPNGVILSALFTNTKQVFIGSSGVTNSGGGEEGLVLYPTQQSIKLPVTNLNQVWLNADVNGEGCGVIVL